MIFRLRAIAISAALAFTIGAGTGAWSVYKIWGFADLTAKNRSLMLQIKNVASALDLGAKIDDANAEIELSNREVTDAIIRKAVALRGPDDPVCIDADGMRDLARLQ